MMLHRNFCRLCVLAILLCACLPASAAAEKTKKLSGKISKVKENVLSIQKAGLVGESYTEVETTPATKITGQLKPGLHVIVKYREEGEKNENGERRKIAVEIETRPEYASKEAKKAAKHLEKQ